MCVNMANALTDMGIPNKVIITRGGGPLIKELKSEFVCINKKGFTDIKAFLKFIYEINCFDPIIIHSHSTSIFWCVLLKYLSSKKKLVWHDHFGGREANGWFRNRVYLLALRKINLIIGVSDSICNYWKSYHLKVRYLNNFPYSGGNIKGNRDFNGIYNIVMLANFKSPKNHKLFLQVISRLVCEKQFQIKAYLIGSDYNDKYSMEIRQIIDTNELGNYIEIINNVSNPFPILEKMHVGVLASDFEGLPMSLLEYSEASLSVVCSDVGNCSAVLNDGKYGYLFKSGSEEDCYEKLTMALNNFNQDNEMRSALQKYVENSFGSSAFFLNYFQFVC